jgi:hypothetical protein
MIFTDEAIESLVESRYHIECILIELTRQEGESVFKFAGPGCLSQNEDGQLLLKLYHTFGDDDELFQSWKASIGSTLPGELIPEEMYFTMEAMDMEGNIWKAEDVLVGGQFSAQANGVVIVSEIMQIRSESERVAHANNEKSSAYIIIPGCHSVPCNEWEDMGTKRTKSLCRIRWAESGISIKVRKKYLFVAISGPSASLDKGIQNRIAEVLSIVFGKMCHIVLSSYCADRICESAIVAVPKTDPNKQIPSPIRHRDQRNFQSFESFLQCYLSCIKQPYGIYYEYWHRINRAWQGGIEIAALAVTTAIEGVLKESFSEYLGPDEEFNHQARAAKEAILSLDLGGRIKSYLCSSLGNASTGTAKNGLRKLKDEGLISQQLINYWSELRNKSTHADSLEFDEEKLQEYLKLVHGCYHLFNILLLTKIGFAGEYTNLSIKGWPAELMTIDDRSKLGQDA